MAGHPVTFDKLPKSLKDMAEFKPELRRAEWRWLPDSRRFMARSRNGRVLGVFKQTN